MRIISGEKKGTVLYGPKNDSIRPTTDRAKEALFNVISPLKQKANVLDLFSGTGAIGIEFLSRGADYITFGSYNKNDETLLNKNLEKTDYKKKSEIIKGDYTIILKKINNKKIKYDYIVLDPPYNSNYIENILKEIEKYDILTMEGLIIIETDKSMIINLNELKYNKIDERKYGTTKFILLSV